MYYIIVALFGLIIGSFLNVCIYRIPKGESIIAPPSRCSACGEELKPLDLVPVISWIFLGGKCRYCKNKISPRYVLIELLTAAIYLLLFYKYKMNVDFVAAAYLMSVLITVFFIDLDHEIIPNGLVVAGLVGGLALAVINLFQPVSIYGDGNWWSPLLGAAIGSGFLLMIAILGILIYRTEDAMGMGDVKIFAPIGMFLGWKMTIVALVLAVLIGGIVGTFLIILRLKERRSTFAFGPFIVAGAFIALLWGWDLLNLYLTKVLNIY